MRMLVIISGFLARGSMDYLLGDAKNVGNGRKPIHLKTITTLSNQRNLLNESTKITTCIMSDRTPTRIKNDS